MPKTRFFFVCTHRVFLLFLDVSRSPFAVYIPEISCYFWANPVMPAATALRRCLCRCFMAPCRCPTCCRVPLGSHTNSWRGNWWAEVGHSWTVKKDEKGGRSRFTAGKHRKLHGFRRMFNGFYMPYKVLRVKEPHPKIIERSLEDHYSRNNLAVLGIFSWDSVHFIWVTPFAKECKSKILYRSL